MTYAPTPASVAAPGGLKRRTVAPVCLTLAPMLFACTPDYRLTVDKIPGSATALRVTAHVYPTQGPPAVVKLNDIPLKDGRDNVSVAFKLDGDRDKQPVVFSVAAIQNDCILASGATDWTVLLGSDAVRDLPLHLQPISPLAAPGSCTEKSNPVILAVERVSRGAWGMQDLKMELYGWNFPENAQPEVRSNVIFQCYLDATMAQMNGGLTCSTLSCADNCPTSERLNAPECKTSCLVTAVVEKRLGSSRMTLSLSPPPGLSAANAANVLGAAMTIKLHPNPTALGTYNEQPPR